MAENRSWCRDCKIQLNRWISLRLEYVFQGLIAQPLPGAIAKIITETKVMNDLVRVCNSVNKRILHLN